MLIDVLSYIFFGLDFNEGLTMRANQALKLELYALRFTPSELTEVRSTLGNDDGDHQAAAVWHAGLTFGWLQTFEVEVFNAG